MKKVLIVEDSGPLMAYSERQCIEQDLGLETETVRSLAETREIVEKKAGDFLIALLDMNLPDAPYGEAIDYVTSKGIPIIVFISRDSDDIRELLTQKDILGYVLKGSSTNFRFVLRLIRYVQQNILKEALIVDDSKVSRAYLDHFLRLQNFFTHQAGSADEAMQILANHPNIHLMLVDYRMPGISGSQLVAEVRKRYGFEDLVIIGISAYGNPVTSVEFLKNGADDFITKPFLQEEFLYRVMQSMQRHNFIQQTQELANRDSLTGLFNRRYLFEIGEKYYENAKRDTLDFSIAMIDIDDFKQVNDVYGHQAGDLVLKTIADLATANMRKADVLTRYGGEEFCFLISAADKEKAQAIMDNMRGMIAKTAVAGVDGCHINVTVSVGVADELGESLAHMIELADQRLYGAKREGKNRVVIR